jgi:predicted nucleic acid-binding protein
VSGFVCDASALVALLLDGGWDGDWVAETIRGGELASPSVVAFETANIIRRHELAQLVSPDQAAQAHADLLDLAIEEWPYAPLAARARELRANLTIYDAGYVALAELIGSTLITLDRALARAPGPRCAIATPPSRSCGVAEGADGQSEGDER